MDQRHLPNQSDLDRQLDQLFASYREACPPPECGADFMPRLWERIDSRQPSFSLLWRWTEGFVAVAAAACLMVFLLQVAPDESKSVVYQSTYVETLAQEQSPEALATQDVALLTVSDENSLNNASRNR